MKVDASFASIDNARLSRLKAYSYGGYTHRKGHSAHFGFGYKDHYGFGYGKHFRPGYSISFSFGSHHYPYYHKRSIRRGYVCYDYGFGYSFKYGGYYSSYYDYCPPVTYRDYSSFYNVTYRTYNYYYPTTTYSSAPTTYYSVAESATDQPHAEGWSLLARGEARAAFRYFSQAASRNLDDGAPKIGYAIASAMIGDHRRAAWAMRRAFEIDPYSVGSISVDQGLYTQLDRLAEEYAKRADRARSADDDFMLAAMSFLIQDYQLAEVAAQAAIDHGDRSQAAQNLKAMIPAEDFSYDR